MVETGCDVACGCCAALEVSSGVVTAMIHDSKVCDCEMCVWANEVEKRLETEATGRVEGLAISEGSERVPREVRA